jgi:hypothetical protein
MNQSLRRFCPSPQRKDTTVPEEPQAGIEPALPAWKAGAFVHSATAACGGMEFCIGAPQTTTLPEVATECNVRESNPLPMLGKHRCHHQHLRCMKPRPGIEPGPRLYQRRVLPLALKRREAYERSRTLHLHLTTGQGTRYTQAWSRLPQEESDLRHLIQSQASYR